MEKIKLLVTLTFTNLMVLPLVLMSDLLTLITETERRHIPIPDKTDLDKKLGKDGDIFSSVEKIKDALKEAATLVFKGLFSTKAINESEGIHPAFRPGSASGAFTKKIVVDLDKDWNKLMRKRGQYSLTSVNSINEILFIYRLLALLLPERVEVRMPILFTKLEPATNDQLYSRFFRTPVNVKSVIRYADVEAEIMERVVHSADQGYTTFELESILEKIISMVALLNDFKINDDLITMIAEHETWLIKGKAKPLPRYFNNGEVVEIDQKSALEWFTSFKNSDVVGFNKTVRFEGIKRESTSTDRYMIGSQLVEVLAYEDQYQAKTDKGRYVREKGDIKDFTIQRTEMVIDALGSFIPKDLSETALYQGRYKYAIEESTIDRSSMEFIEVEIKPIYIPSITGFAFNHTEEGLIDYRTANYTDDVKPVKVRLHIHQPYIQNAGTSLEFKWESKDDITTLDEVKVKKEDVYFEITGVADLVSISQIIRILRPAEQYKDVNDLEVLQLLTNLDHTKLIALANRYATICIIEHLDVYNLAINSMIDEILRSLL